MSKIVNRRIKELMSSDIRYRKRGGYKLLYDDIMGIVYPERRIKQVKYDDYNLMDNLAHKKMSNDVGYQNAMVKITDSETWGKFLFGNYQKTIDTIRFALNELASITAYECARNDKWDKRYFEYELQSTVIYLVGEFSVKNSSYTDFQKDIELVSEKVLSLMSNNSKMILNIEQELVQLADSDVLNDKKVCRIIFRRIKSNKLIN